MDIEQMVTALGSPMRFRILCLLAAGTDYVSAIASELGITSSAVSQHIKVMLEAGLVYRVSRGRRNIYVPIPEAMELLSRTFGSLTVRCPDPAGGPFPA